MYLFIKSNLSFINYFSFLLILSLSFKYLIIHFINIRHLWFKKYQILVDFFFFFFFFVFGFENRTFLCIFVLRITSGPRVKICRQWNALNLPVVYTTDRSKAAFPFIRLFYPTDFGRTAFIRVTNSDQTMFNVGVSFSHLPITRMRNRDQYRMSIRGVSGLALEESKMHTFSRI